VIGNTLKNLNMAGCGESATRSGCVDMNKKDEPQLLQSGIYLARGGARVVATRGNVIRGNRISGRGMKTHCVAAGPRVSLAANVIEGNTCANVP